MANAPFAAGSVAIKLHLHDELDAAGRVCELLRQAELAEELGFDGVVLSEHHAGVLPGYLPVPTSAVGWILAGTERLWAAPCPTLLLLRNAVLVVEELAWLAAAFPGRVGAAFAAGSPGLEFRLIGAESDDLATQFENQLGSVVAMMRAPNAYEGLRDDAALARLVEAPVPTLSAASSSIACERAARLGTGLLLDAEITPAAARRRVDSYQAAGGTGPQVLMRKVWVGEPPHELIARQHADYRRRAKARGRAYPDRPAIDGGFVSGDSSSVAEVLSQLRVDGGADALIITVHLPGLSASQAREQIRLIAGEVLPRLSATARSTFHEDL